MYRQFNIQQFYVLPPSSSALQLFMSFGLLNYFFPLFPLLRPLFTVAFCPHSVFVCFVWIWEYTAIISLYNINWLVFITDLTL
jgi:hypothetical protein